MNENAHPLARPASSTVRVESRTSGMASYDVTIAPGLLSSLGDIARAAAPADFYAIVADDRVAALYGNAAASALSDAGRVELLSFPAGEPNKTRLTWSQLTDALLDLGMSRDGCIIALGGGVTGDLAGFLAASYLRGVPLIQVPTSLLAMIDAAIGGKTGVDVPAGKNLVGAFHHPRAVVVDPLLLKTLPDAQLRAGLAEAVKHGAVADAHYFTWIAAVAEDLIARDETALAALVGRSIAIKAAIVAADPLEQGQRATLNFGHTIAHAIERVTDFTVPHGFAVAMGLVVEARIGEELGVTESGTADRIRAVLRTLGLPLATPSEIDPAAVIDATRSDKKARVGHVRYALVACIGDSARAADDQWTFRVPDAIVLSALAHRPHATRPAGPG